MDLAEALATYEAPSEEAPSAEGILPAEPAPVATPAASVQPEVPAGGAVASPDLFAPEALATPEGIAAARTELTRLREELRTARQKQDSKTSRFEQTKARWLTERNAFTAERDQLRANLNVVRSGSPEQRLTVLSQLTGLPPHELVRELNLSVLKKGPAPDKVATLEKTVQELQAQLQQRTAAEAQARLEQQEEAKYRAELPSVIQSPGHAQAYPTIATYIGEHADHLPEVVDATVRLRQQHFRTTGQVLTEELAFLQVEHQLQRHYRSRPAQPPAAVAPVNQAPSPPAKPTPVAPATGQSLTASELADSGSRRDMSEQESIEAIASDPAALDLLKRMGLI